MPIESHGGGLSHTMSKGKERRSRNTSDRTWVGRRVKTAMQHEDRKRSVLDAKFRQRLTQ